MKSLALANALLDAQFGGPGHTRPSTVWVSLHLDNPSATGAYECDFADGYARVPVANTLANWPAASGGEKTCAANIAFPTATPGGWGTVGYFGIWDAAEGGAFQRGGELTDEAGDPTSMAVAAGDAPFIGAGLLKLTES
ncbi:MAG: hypothetical protein H6716_28245 [Polyangiaceae bacterium]|nr:hypothetical protein [Polyangiaceae bacterium]